MGDETNNETLDFVLRRPITVGGKSYERLTLREPDAGELEAAGRNQTGIGSLMSLIAAVAGVPVGVPQAMVSRDLARANEFFETFSVPPADQGDGDDFIDEVTINLRKPVTIGKNDAVQTFTHLELAEPTGAQKDKAAREPSDMRAAIALISVVAKVPRLVVERLSRRDFEEACNFLASCNVAGQTTGGT